MKHAITQITIRSDQKMVAISHADNRSSEAERDDQGLDVIVELQDGSKYIASFFLYEKLVDEMHTPNSRYDRNHQRYFWRKNMIMVNDFKSDTIEHTIYDLMDEGDFMQAFEKIHTITPSGGKETWGIA